MRFFFIISVLVLGIAILVLFLKHQDEQSHENAARYLNHQLVLFNKAIDEEQNLALAMAVLLSQNPTIIECIKTQNKPLCQKYINQSLQALSRLPHDTIRIHLHTKELKSLLRSWDPNHNGDNLERFRHSLVQVRSNLNPIHGVEAGRHGLFLRGIAPILSKDSYEGSIEVAYNYDHVTAFLAQQYVDFYLLVDKNYAHLSPLFKPHSFGILDHWVIANEGANLDSAYLINSLDLKTTRVQYHKDYAFVSTPIIDINQNLIGHYLLGIDRSREGWKNLSY